MGRSCICCGRLCSFTKRVWIDLFAMRQWNEDHVETFKCIRNVLERCETVLVSWSSDMNLGPYAPFSSLGETRCISEIYLAEKRKRMLF